MKSERTRRATVIGGGISGLTTAHRLGTLAADAGFALEVTLLEASDRVGGVIETHTAVKRALGE